MRSNGIGALVLLVCAAFAGGFVAQWVLGCRTVGAQDMTGDGTVRARQFVVVDAAGRDQIVLGSDSGCTGLVVRDGQAARLLVGMMPDDQTGLVVNDGAQRRQVALTAGRETNDLTLYDGLGDQRITAEVDRDVGNSDLFFSDQNHVPRVAVEMGAQGGGDFIIRNYAGNDIWRASQEAP